MFACNAVNRKASLMRLNYETWQWEENGTAWRTFEKPTNIGHPDKSVSSKVQICLLWKSFRNKIRWGSFSRFLLCTSITPHWNNSRFPISFYCNVIKHANILKYYGRLQSGPALLGAPQSSVINHIYYII